MGTSSPRRAAAQRPHCRNMGTPYQRATTARSGGACQACIGRSTTYQIPSQTSRRPLVGSAFRMGPSESHDVTRCTMRRVRSTETSVPQHLASWRRTPRSHFVTRALPKCQLGHDGSRWGTGHTKRLMARTKHTTKQTSRGRPGCRCLDTSERCCVRRGV